MAHQKRARKTTVTEYWVRPVDQYGDSLDVYFCDSKSEAKNAPGQYGPLYPDAIDWEVELVKRVYERDGRLADEITRHLDWEDL